MKNFLIVAFALSFTVSCGSSSNVPTTKGSFTFTDEIRPKLPAPNKGGQPAVVTLRGVMISSRGEVDERYFHVEQLGGLSINAERVPVDKSKYIAAIDLEEKTKQSLATITTDNFISIGCATDDAIVSEWTENKTPTSKGEQKIGETGMLRADTVVVCGKVPARLLGLQIMANTVVLKDVVFSAEDAIQQFSIVARNLVLLGKNSLSSAGRFVAFIPLAGPEIGVEVLQKVSGGGTLSIHSEGANVESPQQ